MANSHKNQPKLKIFFFFKTFLTYSLEEIAHAKVYLELFQELKSSPTTLAGLSYEDETRYRMEGAR